MLVYIYRKIQGIELPNDKTSIFLYHKQLVKDKGIWLPLPKITLFGLFVVLLIASAVSQDRDYQQHRRQTAREYRRLERDAYRAFPGNRVSLKPFAQLIVSACLCCSAMRQAAGNSTAQTQARAVLAQYQEGLRQAGPDWIQLMRI